MNYLPQKGARDCFPTCFRNAMRHFGVPVTAVLQERLEVFEHGTEHCTIFASEERLEQYDWSIHRMITEWNWAYRHRDDRDCDPAPEPWAVYLIKSGVHLEFRNGPVEQRSLIEVALSEGRVIICEVRMPSELSKESELRHCVLITGTDHRRLFMHDPSQVQPLSVTDKIECGDFNGGTNLSIDLDYFFSTVPGPMKPKCNEYLLDSGYKFVVVSGVGEEELSSDELLNSCWASVPFSKLRLPLLSRAKKDV